MIIQFSFGYRLVIVVEIRLGLITEEDWIINDTGRESLRSYNFISVNPGAHVYRLLTVPFPFKYTG